MAQHTEFPKLPPGEFRAAMSTFISLIRSIPPEGIAARDLRTKLKKASLWSRERQPSLFRFLQISPTDPVLPSPLTTRIAAVDAEQARDLLAERLWEVNPLLFKTVVDQLQERVHSANEILKFLDSFAYPGHRLTGPEIRNWVQFAQGLELFRPVGIRLGLAARGKKFIERAQLFDIDDFLDAEEEEPDSPLAASPVETDADGVPVPSPGDADATTIPEVRGPSAPAPANGAAAPARQPPDPAPPTPRANVAPPPPPLPEGTPDPRRTGAPVPIDRLRSPGELAPELVAETATHLAAWWAKVADDEDALDPAMFDLDVDTWREDPERALFLVAVAAGLCFRLRRPPEDTRRAFAELRESGTLDHLHAGTAPEELPASGDAQALLLASLVSRRCADAPDMAMDLERAPDAAGAFAILNAGLGRGLFDLELFWMMRALETMGALRPAGIPDFVTIPRREVRDTLFRLGLLATPYAASVDDLVAASAAARRLLPDGGPPDRMLLTFHRAAGCAYGCPHRRICQLACRERADLSA